MADGILKKSLNVSEIQAEVDKVDNSFFAKKTDAQLDMYDRLSNMYRERYEKMSPDDRKRLYNRENKKRKLSQKKVDEIRKKYQPYIYGKKRLAIEYGVSTSVIYRILRGKAWKSVEI